MRAGEAVVFWLISTSEVSVEPIPNQAEVPKSFFELVIHDHTYKPAVTGANAGYELGKFGNEGLADYLFEWLPEFALKYSELFAIH